MSGLFDKSNQVSMTVDDNDQVHWNYFGYPVAREIGENLTKLCDLRERIRGLQNVIRTLGEEDEVDRKDPRWPRRSDSKWNYRIHEALLISKVRLEDLREEFQALQAATEDLKAQDPTTDPPGTPFDPTKLPSKKDVKKSGSQHKTETELGEEFTQWARIIAGPGQWIPEETTEPQPGPHPEKWDAE